MDLPYLVTVRVDGASVEQALQQELFSALSPCNVQAAERHDLPGHLEFRTFSAVSEIREHFGLAPHTETSRQQVLLSLYRRTYAMTVGELKAAIADLPDDLPLVHTPHTAPDEHLPNRKGLLVHTGEWAFTGPGLKTWGGDAQWSLRISPVDHGDWKKVLDGTWRNRTAADLCS